MGKCYRRDLNVLVLTTCFPLSEEDISGIFLSSLYKAIAEQQGVTVTVLAADHPGGSKKYDERLSVFGIRVIRYRYFFKKYQRLLYGDAALSNIKKNKALVLLAPLVFLSLLVYTLYLARQNKFSLVHAHWIIPAGLIGIIAKKVYKLPVLITSHGGDVFGIKSRVLKTIATYTLAKADVVNAVSKAVASEIKNMAPNSRVQVVSMGADEELFFPRQLARKSIGLPEDERVLLYVGRLSEKKGVEYLVKAFHALFQRTPGLRLLLVGSGNLENRIRDLVVSFGLQNRIALLGTVENKMLPIYYSSADLVVIPSVRSTGGEEGLPVVLMEALLCDRKVVASKVGGIPEVEGMKGVYLVTPKSLESLVEGIERGLKDRLKPGEVRSGAMKFSIKHISARFLSIYAKLAGYEYAN